MSYWCVIHHEVLMWASVVALMIQMYALFIDVHKSQLLHSKRSTSATVTAIQISTLMYIVCLDS